MLVSLSLSLSFSSFLCDSISFHVPTTVMCGNVILLRTAVSSRIFAIRFLSQSFQPPCLKIIVTQVSLWMLQFFSENFPSHLRNKGCIIVAYLEVKSKLRLVPWLLKMITFSLLRLLSCSLEFWKLKKMKLFLCKWRELYASIFCWKYKLLSSEESKAKRLAISLESLKNILSMTNRFD